MGDRVEIAYSTERDRNLLQGLTVSEGEYGFE